MALTIRSSFLLAAPPATAWEILTDIERAAPCFPGARLLGRNDDGSWRASFVVKLGPMAFDFAGRFQLAELDPEANRVLVKAQGSDTKGRGGAKADVEMRLAAEGATSRADIVSSVDLSGSVAQFGRGAGMIEALSRQLIDQFAVNLQRAIASSPPQGTPAVQPAMPPPSQPVERPAPRAAADGPPSGTETTAASLDAGALMWRALIASIKGWVARLVGRSRS